MPTWISPDEIARRAMEFGCASVAFTYNEPTVFIEYAMDTIRACHALEVNTVAVTNGWISATPRRDFFKMIDAVNIDLKAFNPEFYRRLCGAELDDVLDTIRFAHNETNAWLEITTLLIPGENDSPEEIEKMCDWIVENTGVDTPLHFSAFHPAGNMRNTPSTPLETLVRARETAREKGIRHVYLGNVRECEAGRTRCHSCGELLIDRTGYSPEFPGLDAQGFCRQCGRAWAHGR
jgi:pyruvate formate lyase activating enzyme